MSGGRTGETGQASKALDDNIKAIKRGASTTWAGASPSTPPGCVRSPGIDVSPKRIGGLRALRAIAARLAGHLTANSARGCLILLGTANPDRGTTEIWHRPWFDIDENALPGGVHIMSLTTLDVLRESGAVERRPGSTRCLGLARQSSARQ